MRIIVNGCFDLFHEGHMRLLHEAIKFAGPGGTVCVLINSDESVQKLKGKGRPIDPAVLRLNRIYNFIKEWKSKRFLFGVRIFNSEEELEGRIHNFKPDLIVKGSDRPDIRTVVGHEDFPVVIIPRLPDRSTTKIIEAERLTPQDFINAAEYAEACIEKSKKERNES